MHGWYNDTMHAANGMAAVYELLIPFPEMDDIYRACRVMSGNEYAAMYRTITGKTDAIYWNIFDTETVAIVTAVTNTMDVSFCGYPLKYVGVVGKFLTREVRKGLGRDWYLANKIEMENEIQKG